jgi:hypothetical protein
MTTSWTQLKPAPDHSHHLCHDAPAYAERFDEVLAFHAPGLAPVRRGKDAWHIHPDGRAAYARRFQRTFGFYEGLAAVIGNDGWHHITLAGEDAYPQRHAWCGNFQGGRCSVRETNGAYLHLMPDGKPAYPERWRYAGDFRDGIAVVQADNGYSSHIDPRGGLIHGQWFLDLDVFHKGFARARDAAGWMHIDRHGAPLYTRRFAAVEPFYNGQARVECFNGALEVIDERGAPLVALRPPLRSEFAALSGDMVGFWRTQTIAAAVEAGVFEALPGTAGDIAGRCRLLPERAPRLLRALAELALVRQENETWHCTPRGEYLLAAHPLTLADAAREYAGAFTRMWADLPNALRADGDWRAPDIFAEVASDAARREPHHRMLRSYARHDYAEVSGALALQGKEHVVDAGGGLGVLAGLLLENYPEMRVTLLERPEVIAQAQTLSGQNSRLAYQGGDIFAPWEVRADAVILARVLHDWNDTDALRILRRAREVLPQGGALFVVEMLLPENNPAGGLCDLHLLMATGGQERSLSAYTALLAQAGFAVAGVRRVSALPAVIVASAQ